MRKLKITKIIASTLVLVSALALNPIGASAEWRANSVGWWYAESNSWATGWRNIDGKWYYFDSNGYMAHDTNIGGYQLGSDGAWIVPTPTASTTTTGNTATTTSNTTSGKSGDIIGFDKMELSSSSSGNARKYYNKYCQVSKNINELSIGGEDYLNTYKKGNIPGFMFNGSNPYTDYVFNLNGNYSRFTALAGVDDLIIDGFTKTNMEETSSYIKMTIIADGVVLDTQNLYYGEKAKEIDVNTDSYNELRIRVECKQSSYTGLSLYYDILGGKFYQK